MEGRMFCIHSSEECSDFKLFSSVVEIVIFKFSISDITFSFLQVSPSLAFKISFFFILLLSRTDKCSDSAILKCVVLFIGFVKRGKKEVSGAEDERGKVETLATFKEDEESVDTEERRGCFGSNDVFVESIFDSGIMDPESESNSNEDDTTSLRDFNSFF